MALAPSITPVRNSIDEMCPSPTARRLITNLRSPAASPGLIGGQHQRRIEQRGPFDGVLVGEVGADEQPALPRQRDVAHPVGDQRECRSRRSSNCLCACRIEAAPAPAPRTTSGSGSARIRAMSRPARLPASPEAISSPGRYGLAMTRLASCAQDVGGPPDHRGDRCASAAAASGYSRPSPASSSIAISDSRKETVLSAPWFKFARRRARDRPGTPRWRSRRRPPPAGWRPGTTRTTRACG